MKLAIAILSAALLTTSTALALTSPKGIPIGGGPGHVPFGAGIQRGLQGLNNSGINGFVTLFDRGARTAVVVATEGGGGRPRMAVLARGNSCDAIGRIVERLADLHQGDSRGYVPMTKARLLSGNYLTVVYSSTAPGARPVACGELYD